MQIQYTLTGAKRAVADHVGKALIACKVARAVYQTREIEPEPVSKFDAEEEVEISPRTGKPKRQYKRRDMQPE